METTHASGGQEIRHEDGRFFVERDGRTLAELTYARDAEGRAVLQHTRVSDELRGQGVARRLVDAAVAWARATGTRLVPVCSYARTVFERDASLADVLG